MGGGVNLYSQSMAVKLVQAGHDVFSVSSGFAYDFKSRTYIKKNIDYMGVKNYEVFNAPNLSPGFFNYENPMQDISEPVVEGLFKNFLNDIQPDIVHFHNIEGFSATCISIAVKSGARVLFSLHNYHPVCNQICLLYRDREICEDFAEGKKCLDCIKPPPYSSELRKRKWAYHIARLPWGNRIWCRGQSTLSLAPVRTSMALVNSLWLHAKDKSCGKNHPRSIHDEYAYQQFAIRRKQNIEAINEAHLIHAVSDFVKEFYIGQGIKRARVVTCHIGNRMAEVVLQRDFHTSVLSKNDRLNMVFLGTSVYSKGLPFFLEALISMDDKLLEKINLHIYARAVWKVDHLITNLTGRVPCVKTFDGYDFNSLPDILSGMNYGVVPPLWYDNAPQVVFEMMAMKVPVIGARIGGIPDFVKHMENGVLFKPGDKADLAEKIAMVVMNRSLEDRLRSVILPMKTPDQHVLELERYYQGI